MESNSAPGERQRPPAELARNPEEIFRVGKVRRARADAGAHRIPPGHYIHVRACGQNWQVARDAAQRLLHCPGLTVFPTEARACARRHSRPMDTVVLLSLLAGFASGALAAWMLARVQFRGELTESISTHQATVSAAQALFHQTTRRLSEVQGELTRSRDDLDRSRADAGRVREAAGADRIRARASAAGSAQATGTARSGAGSAARELPGAGRRRAEVEQRRVPEAGARAHVGPAEGGRLGDRPEAAGIRRTGDAHSRCVATSGSETRGGREEPHGNRRRNLGAARSDRPEPDPTAGGDHQPRPRAADAHGPRALGRNAAPARGRDGRHVGVLRFRRAVHDRYRERPHPSRFARPPARRPHRGHRREGPSRSLPRRAGGHRRSGCASRSWPTTRARSATT